MSSPKVVIFGIGDFARIAAVYLRKDSPYEVVAFTANRDRITTDTLLGLPVIPFETITESHPPSAYAMFVAIGFSKLNRARAGVYAQAKALGYELISYINSKATLWGEVEIGDNCFIFEENVIQPFVKIGDDVILWSGNHIGHDTTIGSHVFIASHAVVSGNVTIGDYCFVGVNATFADGVKVAPRCFIGAGALITHDTVEEGVYKGQRSEPKPYKSSEMRGL